MNSRRMATLCLLLFGLSWAFQSPRVDAAVIGTASPADASASMKQATTSPKPPMAGVPVGTAPPAVALPKTPPQRSNVRAFKTGECPLTKGSDGVWHGPDGNAVDDKIAHVGDCKGNK